MSLETELSESRKTIEKLEMDWWTNESHRFLGIF